MTTIRAFHQTLIIARNTSAKRRGYATLPEKQHLFWLGPLFILVQLNAY